MNCVDFLFENSFHLSRNLILGPKEEVTYSDIWQKIVNLAAWIRNEVGENQKIVLSAANGSFFIVAYCAIMKSGNVCVPLNPAIEQEGFYFIAKKVNCRLMFLSRQVAGRLKPATTLVTEDMLDRICSTSGLALNDFQTPIDQLAQIIFTSGSTALPKGVMISHRNIIANTTSIVDYLQLTENDRIAVVLPFFYCYGLSLLHTHIRVGGGIVLNNTFMLLGSVINDLKKYKCTGFAGVPSHYQILLRKSDAFKKSEFPDLRYVTQAGGKLHNTFILEFIESFSKIKFFVMYGQTEATARLSYLPPEMLPEKIGSLGRGIPGVKLEVVDENRNPVPPHVTGEIMAKGDNVMLGYYEDEEATAKAFHNGWLLTGDLAYKDDDGFIYLTARKKEIIKVGGKRVSPKEIEEVIVSMPGVIDCSIEAVDDEILGEAIKAILVVASACGEITSDKIRLFCSTRLATYKIPSHFEFVDEIKTNSTGKKVKY
jgi:acyl-CoA synthetase (AMP-forming)/AMP-acid ligase II